MWEICPSQTLLGQTNNVKVHYPSLTFFVGPSMPMLQRNPLNSCLLYEENANVLHLRDEKFEENHVCTHFNILNRRSGELH